MGAAGPSLAAAVHRPFAEQLLGTVDIAPAARVLVVSAGDDELSRRLPGSVTVGRDDVDGLPDSAFDVALSVFGVAVDDSVTARLDALSRMARTVRLLVWLNGDTHERALRLAVRGNAAPPRALVLPPGWGQTELLDVVRFDGIDPAWHALVVERGVPIAPDEQPGVRARFAAELAPYTAADGTMRIPARATLLRAGPVSRPS